MRRSDASSDLPVRQLIVEAALSTHTLTCCRRVALSRQQVDRRLLLRCYLLRPSLSLPLSSLAVAAVAAVAVEVAVTVAVTVAVGVAAAVGIKTKALRGVPSNRRRLQV